MRYILALLVLALSISCTGHKPHVNEITKVTLTRSGAWADPGATTSIDSALNYEYYGLINGETLPQVCKFYKGAVTAKFWDTLNANFEQIKYKKLDTTTDYGVMDASYFELIIHWNNGKRRIVRVDTGSISPVIQTLRWLNDSYKTVKLHRVDTPFKFETTLPDPPSINQVHFPPPVKKKSFTK